MADTTINPEEQPISDVTGYDQQIAILQDAAKQYAPESEEEKRKREKRERSAKIVGAVSDGLAALSNLYFTSQYAPDMYEREKGQLKSTNDKLDKLKAERQANADKYINYALQIGNAQNAKAKTLRDIAAQKLKEELALKKDAREEEDHGWKRKLQPDILREQKGKADKEESNAVTARVRAEFAPKQEEADLEKKQAQTGAANASAAASNASAAKSNLREFSAWDENGREHKFANKDAAERFAKQHGTWEETEIEETSVQDSEFNGRTTTNKKRKGGHPARPKRQSPTR